MPRRASNIDANQPEIVKKLRDRGVEVYVTSDIGGGFPDLVCAYQGVNILVEIKNPKKSPAGQRLTPAQRIFHKRWKLHGPCIVAKCTGDVMKAFTRELEKHDSGQKIHVR